jgi:hypothetical protein
MAHGDAREGKWRGNWRMEWVASTFKLPRNMVYPVLLPLMRTPRLPVFDWTDAPADLNGLVRFVERRNLVFARVPSHFKRSLAHTLHRLYVSEFTEGREQFVSKLERRHQLRHFQQQLCYENIWCLHLGVSSLNASCQTTLEFWRSDYASGMSNDRGYV